MKSSRITTPSLLLAIALLSGCGRPPSNGGPPGEFVVTAVIAPATAETIQSTIQLVGSLKARDAINVVSEISASVSEILFEDGQEVKKDQIIARLDDAKITARLNEARARFQLARTNFERNRNLYSSQTISRQEFDQAESEFQVAEAAFRLLERELSDTVIKAPFDGVVGERLVSIGQFLNVGQPVTHLVRMDPLEVEFRVPERHLSRIALGQPVVMKSPAFSAETLSGVISFIDPIVNPDTRTVLTKALIQNENHRFRPGLFGSLDVILEERPNAIVIPESAVRYAGDQASVVIMDANDRAEFRNVVVGQRLPGRIEIVEGLSDGERVVVEGYQKMGPGTGIVISPASAKYGITPSSEES
ncbi:MAG TPA: efflux RND transporter periplasmic adaptor subunit [Kiritimatiellia bacterium]|nr:efflux RND transporter periplasmic adaptor subunit [Kiritimatiellia bacterium]